MARKGKKRGVGPKRRSQPDPVLGFFSGSPPKRRRPDGDPRLISIQVQTLAGDAESGEEGSATAKVQL
jgi:hypothetical protein